MKKMAVLVALLLFAIGWWLISEGTQFFGFLAIVAGVLALLSKPPSVTQQKTRTASSAPGYYPPPVIIRSSPSQSMQKVDVRLKDKWWGTTAVEDFFHDMGHIVLWPVKILWRLLRIGGKKKK